MLGRRGQGFTLAACLAVALVAGSGTAVACPSCGARAKEGGAGYMAATALLVALPFASIGGFVLWLRKKNR